MKIRNGFVSNSSSSSFIVAGESEADLKNLKIEIKVDLSNYGTIIKSKLELDEWFKDEYCYTDYTIEEFLEDEPYWKDKYEAMAKAISEGKVVCQGRCSDDTGDSVELFLCENGLSGVFGDKVTVIDGEGGY